MRSCCSLFRKNTDFICPQGQVWIVPLQNSGDSSEMHGFTELHWKQVTSWHVCVGCKQRCVLQFAAWLTFLRPKKYTDIVVCAAFMRDRKEHSKVLFFHLHWNDCNLFIGIDQGRGLISKVLTSSQKLADCLSPPSLGKGYACTCKMLTCWLTMTTRIWCEIHIKSNRFLNFVRVYGILKDEEITGRDSKG